MSKTPNLEVGMKAHKEKLRVIIYTPQHRIKGEVHLYENSRLTDILNADTATKDFLPLTNAHVTDLRDQSQSEVHFLSINRKFIELVLEDDEAIALAKSREMMAKRKYPEALQFADRAVRASPNNAEAHYYFGFCLAKTNDFKGARAAFEKCLKLRPDPEIAQQAQEALNTLGS
jgi:tetratricopeptide (TPR) repeat protein